MLHLVTGGSGSGKSEYAERLAMTCGGGSYFAAHRDRRRQFCRPLIYLATMKVWDEEGRRRVRRHRAMRAGKGFRTIERYSRLEELTLPEELCAGVTVTGRPVVLLECMSNLAANEYYRERDGVTERILRGIEHLGAQCGDLVIVTNEVFSDGIFYDAQTEEYLEILGEINCRLGRQAGTVTEVVCGLPVKYK